MKNLVKRHYPCSVEELYSVADTVIRNFNTFKVDFSSFRKIYDDPFSGNLAGELDGCIALPRGRSNYSAAGMLHNKLMRGRSECLRNYRKVKRYIMNAWSDAADQHVQLGDSGAGYYNSAYRGNLDSMKSLNTAVTAYIAHQLDALKANDNMPVLFKDRVDAAAEVYSTDLSNYRVAEKINLATAAKVAANNALYGALMNLMSDAHAIFEDDSDKKQLFVFTALLEDLRSHTSGVKMHIKLANFMPAFDATVKIEREGEPTEVLEADENGELQRMIAAGPLKIVIEAPDMMPETIVTTLTEGSYKTLDVVLKAA